MKILLAIALCLCCISPANAGKCGNGKGLFHRLRATKGQPSSCTVSQTVPPVATIKVQPQAFPQPMPGPGPTVKTKKKAFVSTEVSTCDCGPDCECGEACTCGK